jgi:hypothetical protein
MQTLFQQSLPPMLQPLWSLCLRNTHTARAGIKFAEQNIFFEENARSPTASPMYEVIDCQLFGNLLSTHAQFLLKDRPATEQQQQQRILLGWLQLAIQENWKRKLDAASSHLLLTLRSLIDSLLLLDTFPSRASEVIAMSSAIGMSDHVASMRTFTQTIFAHILTPSMIMLSGQLRDKSLFVREQVARIALTCMSVCNTLHQAHDPHCLDMINEQQWSVVCEALLSVVCVRQSPSISGKD